MELKSRIARAVAVDDFAAAGSLLDELRSHWENAQGDAAGEQPGLSAARCEPLRSSLLARFQAWAASVLDHPDRVPVRETEELRSVLERWFDRVELRATATGFEMTCVPLGAGHARTVAVDYGRWRMTNAAAGYPRHRGTHWTPQEIVCALHAWVAEHGEPPASPDWKCATQSHPMMHTVMRTFGSWRAGLEAAGYSAPRPRRRPPTPKRDRHGRYLPARS
jgi:hypothetical protein